MPSKPAAQKPDDHPHGPGQPLSLHFQHSTSETGVCNAYDFDHTSLPGFIICTFGTVLAEEVVSRWTFAIEPRLAKLMRPILMDYLVQIRKQVQVGPYIQPKVPIARPRELPRPIDWLGAARQESTAEFVFYCWSWHAATAVMTDPAAVKSVQASLYAILRCSLAMQVSWIADLYDSDNS
jgi:hypothetical protein